jgi:hypothetical protein
LREKKPGFEKRRTMHNILPENIKARDHKVDIGVDGKIILKWIINKA